MTHYAHLSSGLLWGWMLLSLLRLSDNQYSVNIWRGLYLFHLCTFLRVLTHHLLRTQFPVIVFLNSIERDDMHVNFCTDPPLHVLSFIVINALFNRVAHCSGSRTFQILPFSFWFFFVKNECGICVGDVKYQ